MMMSDQMSERPPAKGPMLLCREAESWAPTKRKAETRRRVGKEKRWLERGDQGGRVDCQAAWIARP